MMKKLAISLVVGLFCLFFTSTSFAQDAVATGQTQVQVTAQPQPQPQVVYVQVPTAAAPVYAPAPVVAPEPEWKRQSRIYRGVGWSFFGGGLALAIIGPAVALGAGMASGSATGLAGSALAGWSLLVLGSLMVPTGIGLLIADAVKFNPLRRAEQNQMYGFTWQPNFYVTPEMAGFGISGRF